jgi:hypothetical protein
VVSFCQIPHTHATCHTYIALLDLITLQWFIITIVSVCRFVCVSVCVCMYVCTRIYVCMYSYMCVCVCIYVCMNLCTLICVCVCISRHLLFLFLQLHVQTTLTSLISILNYVYKSQSSAHVLSKFSHLLIPSSYQYFPQKCFKRM